MSRLFAWKRACIRSQGLPWSCRFISQDGPATPSHQNEAKQGHASKNRGLTMNPGLTPILSRINREKGTISTPVGDLPISPLMDADYHENRVKWTKPKAPQRTIFEKQKWRRQLDRNPYALALATPVRRCPGTTLTLPKFFLQDFNIVLHPETGQPWYVPTSLALSGQQKARGDGTEAKIGPPKKPAGPTGHLLARQDYLAQQNVNGELHSKDHKRLMALHHASDRIRATANKAIWRDDMDALILTLMRRRVLEDLIYLSTLSADNSRDPYIVRCNSWDEVKADKYRGQRGCVLWSGQGDGPGPRAAMNIPGVKFGRKIAVHNLWRLLGTEGVERLRGEVALFTEGEIFLVLRKRTVEMQMKLWKLQGYLAHEFVPYLDPSTGKPREDTPPVADVPKDDEAVNEKEWADEEEWELEEHEEADLDADDEDLEKQVRALRSMEAEIPSRREKASF